MSPTSKSSLSAPAPASPVPSGSKDKFDTFETKFFERGDEGANLAVEVERFDDLDEGHKPRKFAPSREFLLGVVVGSASVAILGCVALWLAGTRTSRPATFSASAAPDPTPAAPAAPAVVQAEPVPPPVAPAVAPIAPAVAKAEPEPTPTPAAPVVPAVAKAESEPAPAPAAAPTLAAPAAAKPEPEPIPTLAVPTPAVPTPAMPAADSTLVRSNCTKAIKEKRNKEILAVCAEAFAADPSAADIAVALARTEFDRGRSAQALAWSKKAIAVDPNAADAYVFIGGAEQNVGHGKAAKEAYRRYLQLAPGGRYAADLRAIVGSR
jgi:hypothetical protein